MIKKRILVLFPNEWDEREFKSARLAAHYETFFEGFDLFKFPDNARLMWFNCGKFIAKVLKKYRGRHLQAVMSSDEQYGAMIAAVIAEKLGLPTTSPQSVLLAQHKWYARERMRAIAPEATPRYSVFKYTNPDPACVGLPYPVIVKPVKATYSILSKVVHDFGQVREHLGFKGLEKRILEKLTQPCDDLSRQYLPSYEVDAQHIIAEEIIKGHQVTVEGFADRGSFTMIGVVDSFMYPDTMAFERFEYPSRLPESVQARMLALVEKLMAGFGFSHGLFNVELFYLAETDEIKIIEINPRMAYQFSDLYQKVDGFDTYSVAVSLALGEKPFVSRRAGRYKNAASFVLRAFEKTRIKSAPTHEEVRQIEKKYRDARFLIYLKKGSSLDRELKWLGSYRYAVLNMGGENLDDLFDRYHAAKSELKFSFA
jgi:biotin carboxylase